MLASRRILKVIGGDVACSVVAGPRTSLGIGGAVPFVGASHSLRPVLANCRVLGASVVAGGALTNRWVLGGVLLIVSALLSWRLVLASRRILVVFGCGLVCSVVAGGA